MNAIIIINIKHLPVKKKKKDVMCVHMFKLEFLFILLLQSTQNCNLNYVFAYLAADYEFS